MTTRAAFSQVGFVAIPAGFLLGWIVSRRWPVAGLLAAGALQLLGGLVLWLLPQSVPAAFAGAFLLEAGEGGVYLGVAVALAGGRGGIRDFFLAYGTSWLFCGVVGMVGLQLGMVVLQVGLQRSSLVLTLLVLLGTACLLPVPLRLFGEAPPPRGHPLQPLRRSPVAVGFLAACVPFYGLYWLYRAHGEAAALAPGRRLLTPRAAVILPIGIDITLALLQLPLVLQLSHSIGDARSMEIAYLVVFLALPFRFFIPAILLTVVDALNDAAQAEGRPRVGSPVAMMTLGALIVPVGIGLAQAALERSARAAAEATVPAPVVQPAR